MLPERGSRIRPANPELHELGSRNANSDEAEPACSASSKNTTLPLAQPHSAVNNAKSTAIGPEQSGTTSISSRSSANNPRTIPSPPIRNLNAWGEVLTQLNGSTSWPSVTTQADGIKFITISIIHFSCALLYTIASLILQVLSQVTSSPPNSAELQLVMMQESLGNSAHEDVNITNSHLASLVDIEKQQTKEFEQLLEALHQLIKSCVSSKTWDSATMACMVTTEELGKTSPSVDPIRNVLVKRKIEGILETISSTRDQPGVRQPPVLYSPAVYAASGALVVSIVLAVIFYIWRFNFKSSSRIAHIEKSLPLSETHSEDLDETIVPPVGMSSATECFTSNLNAVNRKQGTKILRQQGDIWAAASQGDLGAISELYFLGQIRDVDEVHPIHGSILTAAARSGQEKLVATVLSWGADSNIQGGQYFTALQAGTHSRKVEVVERLLAAKAKPDVVGGFYGTVLIAAAERASFKMLSLLMDEIKDKNIVNANGGTHGTALMAAASRGNNEMVTLLLDRGAIINSSWEANTTALHTAVTEYQTETVKLLLNRGASVDQASDTHGTALHIACLHGYEDVALLLIKNGADIHLVDKQRRLPLHHAVKYGLVGVTDFLLERYVSSEINARDADNCTALHHASIGGHDEIIRRLLSHGTDVSISDKYNAQALFRAAGCHHTNVVRLLLEAGADPNASESFGRTALHGPSETDDTQIQELLVRHGANVNVIGNDGRTALHEACNMNKFINTRFLLSQGHIDINVKDHRQHTPLHYALSSSNGRHEGDCHERIVMLLLDQPAIDVNAGDGGALCEAAVKGKVEIIEKMLQCGANIHITGGKYGGVVQAAAISGSVATLRLLLQPGRCANVNSQSGEFGTPLQAAGAFGNVAAMEILLEHGALDIDGVGRYGSVAEALGKKMTMTDMEKGRVVAKMKRMLENYGYGYGSVNRLPVKSIHLEDRWLLMSNGWTWAPSGEL